MSFHFVDRILSLDSNQRIHGLKNVTRSDGLFYALPNGDIVLSPAVVTEALAQLGSWLKMAATDFTKRPVLLADELTTYHSFVRPGEQIELFVELIDLDDEVVSSKSYAVVNGVRVLSTQCCRGYLLPIEEFDDRDKTLREFKTLFKPNYVKPTLQATVPSFLDKIAFGVERFRMLDGVTKIEPYEHVSGYKLFATSEDYFATHFPRKPVVPGVFLMTLMGELSQLLVQEDLMQPDWQRIMIPKFLRNLSFRKFVQPGDHCSVELNVKEGDCRKDGEDIVVQAVMWANGKRVMQGEMGFRTMSGDQAPALLKPTRVRGAEDARI